jgi:GT2 family glycosyltransferase
VTNKVAAFIVNYNMPERADALATHLNNFIKHPLDVYLIDNGSNIKEPARLTNVYLPENVQTTRGWLAGMEKADEGGGEYFAYWFLITSAAFIPKQDVLSPMVSLLELRPEAVGIHPALTITSTTAWKHLINRCGSYPRRTWMIDNIASLWRADWLDSIGRFDPNFIYGWGIDLETCYKARKQGKSLWIDDRVKVQKITDIGYKMDRMNMSADQRRHLAHKNMVTVMVKKYGYNWQYKMTKENVDASWA